MSCPKLLRRKGYIPWGGGGVVYEEGEDEDEDEDGSM
jgi:hypothetical protein